MFVRRQEVLARAIDLFRAAEYSQARETIAQPAIGTPTEAAALAYLDGCLARLLGETSPNTTVPRPDPRDPVADEAFYWNAYSLWLDRKLVEAHEVLRSHEPLTDYFRANFLLLRGWLFAAAGRLPEQTAVTVKALGSLLDSNESDEYLIANASLALSALAREMPSPEAQRLLERSLTRLSEAKYAYTILHVRRALAQIEALQGRYTTALRHLTFAGELAREPVDRAFLHFDYALIATWAKQMQAAEAAFDVGRATIEHLDLEGRKDESAFVLTVAAIAGASIEPETAAAFAQRAASIIPNLSPRWAVNNGPRASALVAEALALTTNDTDDAVALATSAGKTFESLGYLWRAGRLAAHLHTLTGHTSYRRRAERLLEAYPDGPLALGDDPINLPPRLREILTMLSRGDSIEDIAYALSISPHTVRKHVSRLHARYHVSRRAQLLAKVGTAAS